MVYGVTRAYVLMISIWLYMYDEVEWSQDPPFFKAAVLYMGNGFMHARDVLNTPQAWKRLLLVS